MSLPFSDSRTEEVMERAFDIRGRSLWDDARTRLVRNRAAVVSIVVLSIIALLAIFGPLIAAYGYDQIDYSIVSCAPNWWPASSSFCCC